MSIVRIQRYTLIMVIFVPLLMKLYQFPKQRNGYNGVGAGAGGGSGSGCGVTKTDGGQFGVIEDMVSFL